jgi:hypothetical protein
MSDDDTHVKLVLPANYVIAASSSAVHFPVIEEPQPAPQVIQNEPPPYEGGEPITPKEKISYSSLLRLIELVGLIIAVIYGIVLLALELSMFHTYRLGPDFTLFLIILCFVVRIKTRKDAKSPSLKLMVLFFDILVVLFRV